MLAQFILRMALSLLIVKYANAETDQNRGDFNFQLKKDSKVYVNEISDHDILKIIQTLGLDVNEDSELYIHEEINYIDFSCFNCIIVNLSETQQEGPINDFIIK